MKNSLPTAKENITNCGTHRHNIIHHKATTMPLALTFTVGTSDIVSIISLKVCIRLLFSDMFPVQGDKLFCSLSKSQIDELPYNRFDEVPKNHIQKDIIDDIMNLPPDEQEQLRNYIAIRRQLSSSVAANEPERKVSEK